MMGLKILELIIVWIFNTFMILRIKSVQSHQKNKIYFKLKIATIIYILA